MNHLNHMRTDMLRRIFAIVAVVALFSSPLAIFMAPIAHGQIDGQIDTPYKLLSPLPCLGDSCPGSTGNGTEADFKTYVGYAYNLFIALAAVTAVFMIVLGGFEYVTSTIPGVKTEGMKRVKSALWGLLLIFGSYLILKTVNPQLVQIPSTLVPQITIQDLGDLARNTNGDFYQQLANEEAQYAALNHTASAESVAARDDKEQTQTLLNGVNAQISKALGSSNSVLTDDQIAAACSDPEQSYTSGIDSLCAQRASDINRINTDNSKQTSTALTADFGTALQNAANDATNVNVSTLQNSINQLNIAYQNLRPQVTDPTQQQTVDNQYNFAEGKLNIQTYIQQANPQDGASVDTAKANLQNIIDNVVPKISDPTLSNNLKNAATTAQNQIQNDFINAHSHVTGGGLGA